MVFWSCYVLGGGAEIWQLLGINSNLSTNFTNLFTCGSPWDPYKFLYYTEKGGAETLELFTVHFLNIIWMFLLFPTSLTSTKSSRWHGRGMVWVTSFKTQEIQASLLCSLGGFSWND